ncbi:MAG: response regulator [Fibrobacterota bacterium]|nr:response regulator [Fibrobacterota bacterium]QQS06295.1 MAG: response regulator [Fibrobacterota bacterium]
MDSRPILLVEDNPDDVLLTRRAFRKMGIPNEIVAVSDGVAAIEALSVSPFDKSLPALVLLDLKLPKVDGIEVLRKIREVARTRIIRVVVLTSSREEKDILRCAELGANSYIRKPIDFDEFLRAVQKISDYWLTLDESIQEITP